MQNYQNHFNCVNENRSAIASVSSSLVDQPGAGYLGPTFREVRSDCALAAFRNQRKSGGQRRLELYLLLCFARMKKSTNSLESYQQHICLSKPLAVVIRSGEE